MNKASGIRHEPAPLPGSAHCRPELHRRGSPLRDECAGQAGGTAILNTTASITRR